MNRTVLLSVVLLGCTFGAHRASAQELSRYRGYVLGSDLAAVLATGGLREADVKPLHVRPARVQEVEWRAPYTSSQIAKPDPVHDVRFTFIDDRLYRIVVTYERDRMAGLTPDDVTGSLSAAYGAPTPHPRRHRGPGLEKAPIRRELQGRHHRRYAELPRQWRRRHPLTD